MPEIRVDNLGSVGLNTDVLPSSLLPAQAFTDLYNIKLDAQGLRSIDGQSKLFDLQIKPLFHTVFGDQDENEWLIVSDGVKVHAYSILGGGAGGGPANAVDISNGDGDWSGDGFVSFANLNGVLVVNDSLAGPHYWPGPSNTLVKLPGPGDGNGTPANGWDWTNGWRCRYMIAYKYYLVALGMTESTVVYPHKFRWSNSAAEGQLPTEWAILTTNDAGDELIGETPGSIVGGALLRDTLVIVKEDALYQMAHIGGQFIMETKRIFGTKGTKFQRGFIEVKDAVAVFSGYDLILFDGSDTVSIIEDRIRNKLTNTMSKYANAVHQLFYHEPTARLFLQIAVGTSQLTDAFVFDLQENTWGHRRLNFGLGMGPANVVVSGGDVWDVLNDPGPPEDPTGWPRQTVWNEQNTGPWDVGSYRSIVPDILLLESHPDNLSWWCAVKAQSTTNSDGSPKYCKAERQGLPLAGPKGMAQVVECYLELSGNAPITITFGSQESPNGTPTWGKPLVAQPGLTKTIDPRITGRFLSYKIESNVAGSWVLGAMTIVWEPAGVR